MRALMWKDAKGLLTQKVLVVIVLLYTLVGGLFTAFLMPMTSLMMGSDSRDEPTVTPPVRSRVDLTTVHRYSEKREPGILALAQDGDDQLRRRRRAMWRDDDDSFDGESFSAFSDDSSDDSSDEFIGDSSDEFSDKFSDEFSDDDDVRADERDRDAFDYGDGPLDEFAETGNEGDHEGAAAEGINGNGSHPNRRSTPAAREVVMIGVALADGAGGRHFPEIMSTDRQLDGTADKGGSVTPNLRPLSAENYERRGGLVSRMLRELVGLATNGHFTLGGSARNDVRRSVQDEADAREGWHEDHVVYVDQVVKRVAAYLEALNMSSRQVEVKFRFYASRRRLIEAIKLPTAMSMEPVLLCGIFFDKLPIPADVHTFHASSDDEDDGFTPHYPSARNSTDNAREPSAATMSDDDVAVASRRLAERNFQGEEDVEPTPMDLLNDGRIGHKKSDAFYRRLSRLEKSNLDDRAGLNDGDGIFSVIVGDSSFELLYPSHLIPSETTDELNRAPTESFAKSGFLMVQAAVSRALSEAATATSRQVPHPHDDRHVGVQADKNISSTFARTLHDGQRPEEILDDLSAYSLFFGSIDFAGKRAPPSSVHHTSHHPHRHSSASPLSSSSIQTSFSRYFLKPKAESTRWTFSLVAEEAPHVASSLETSKVAGMTLGVAGFFWLVVATTASRALLPIYFAEKSSRLGEVLRGSGITPLASFVSWISWASLIGIFAGLAVTVPGGLMSSFLGMDLSSVLALAYGVAMFSVGLLAFRRFFALFIDGMSSVGILEIVSYFWFAAAASFRQASPVLLNILSCVSPESALINLLWRVMIIEISGNSNAIIWPALVASTIQVLLTCGCVIAVELWLWPPRESPVISMFEDLWDSISCRDRRIGDARRRTGQSQQEALHLANGVAAPPTQPSGDIYNGLPLDEFQRLPFASSNPQQAQTCTAAGNSPSSRQSTSTSRIQLHKPGPLQACLIETNKLSKSFRVAAGLRRQVVDNLSLSIYSHEIFALLGHNGAGKTSLLKMLSGQLALSSGSFKINGIEQSEDTACFNWHSLCPQDNLSLTGMTIGDHLTFFGSVRGVDFSRSSFKEAKRQVSESTYDVRTRTTSDALFRNGNCVAVLEVLKILGLFEKINEVPDKLSGGQQRKFWVVIALMGSAPIVYLDEPSSGLDPESRRTLWSLLKIEKCAGRAILLTTHNMEEADVVADRKAVISSGRLEALGTSLFLKRAFNLGYRLTLEMHTTVSSNNVSINCEDQHDDGEEQSSWNSSTSFSAAAIRALEFVRRFVPNATLAGSEEATGAESNLGERGRDDSEQLRRVKSLGGGSRRMKRKLQVDGTESVEIFLPESGIPNFGDLFDALDESMEPLGCKIYGLLQSTLEEVFFRLQEECDRQNTIGDDIVNDDNVDENKNKNSMAGSTNGRGDRELASAVSEQSTNAVQVSHQKNCGKSETSREYQMPLLGGAVDDVDANHLSSPSSSSVIPSSADSETLIAKEASATGDASNASTTNPLLSSSSKTTKEKRGRFFDRRAFRAVLRFRLTELWKAKFSLLLGMLFPLLIFFSSTNVFEDAALEDSGRTIDTGSKGGSQKLTDWNVDFGSSPAGPLAAAQNIPVYLSPKLSKMDKLAVEALLESSSFAGKFVIRDTSELIGQSTRRPHRASQGFPIDNIRNRLIADSSTQSRSPSHSAHHQDLRQHPVVIGVHLSSVFTTPSSYRPLRRGVGQSQYRHTKGHVSRNIQFWAFWQPGGPKILSGLLAGLSSGLYRAKVLNEGLSHDSYGVQQAFSSPRRTPYRPPPALHHLLIQRRQLLSRSLSAFKEQEQDAHPAIAAAVKNPKRPSPSAAPPSLDIFARVVTDVPSAVPMSVLSLLRRIAVCVALPATFASVSFRERPMKNHLLSSGVPPLTYWTASAFPAQIRSIATVLPPVVVAYLLASDYFSYSTIPPVAFLIVAFGASRVLWCCFMSLQFEKLTSYLLFNMIIDQGLSAAAGSIAYSLLKDAATDAASGISVSRIHACLSMLVPLYPLPAGLMAFASVAHSARLASRKTNSADFFRWSNGTLPPLLGACLHTLVLAIALIYQEGRGRRAMTQKETFNANRAVDSFNESSEFSDNQVADDRQRTESTSSSSRRHPHHQLPRGSTANQLGEISEDDEIAREALKAKILTALQSEEIVLQDVSTAAVTQRPTMMATARRREVSMQNVSSLVSASSPTPTDSSPPTKTTISSPVLRNRTGTRDNEADDDLRDVCDDKKQALLAHDHDRQQAGVDAAVNRHAIDSTGSEGESSTSRKIFEELNASTEKLTVKYPVVVDEVTYVHQPSNVAVCGVSFSVERGEIFGLLGPNGAGKSTTIGLLLPYGSLTRPLEGGAYLAGRDVGRAPLSTLPELGVCEQKTTLFENASFDDNLRFAGRLRGVPESELTAFVTAALKRLDPQHNMNPETQVSKASGGMARRLALLMAYATDPDVIILDEPSAGLDPLGRRQMVELIEAESAHRATLLTTHLMEEAEALADRLAVMVNSRYVCIGKILTIKERYGCGYVWDCELRDGEYDEDDEKHSSETAETMSRQSNTNGDNAGFNKSRNAIDLLISLAEQAFCKSCRLVGLEGKSVKFEVRGLKLGAFFRTMTSTRNVNDDQCDDNDEAPTSLVEAYGISQSSIEQIFLQLAAEQRDRGE